MRTDRGPRLDLPRSDLTPGRGGCLSRNPIRTIERNSATNAPAAQICHCSPGTAGGPAQSAPPTTAYILFDDKGNVAQIPFEFSGNEILMPIHINRLQPSPFIVDSREIPPPSIPNAPPNCI